MAFRKNTAVTGFSFGLVSKTDGSDVTTGTTNGFVTIDGGVQTALTNSPTHAGNGQWEVDLTAAEMNGDIIGLVFTNTSAITKQVTISTEVKLVSELKDFDNTTDQVIVATNNDKTGYSISGTKTTLDTLNDIAATDIVSNGAITTLSGAVVNVDLVDVCTTNTDQRGTDNALLASSYVAPDNATISNIDTNVSALNDFDPLTQEVLSNVVKISGDTLAADNLEAQFDGTGLTGDKFPATQQQISTLSVGAGGISTIASSRTLTIGTEVGTFNNTFALDGSYHTINPVGGSTDFYYQFNVGTNGVATEITWDGYVQANNDIINIYGWDWVLSSWIQVGSILGANGTILKNETFVITNFMTGTGANQGAVRIRFQSNNADNTNTDRILCQYTAIPESAFVLHSGVAQAGGSNYIDLDATASAIDDFYTRSRVIISAGTGTGQENIITDYDGTTKRAVVKFAWKIQPDSTSVFNITPSQGHCATSSGGYDGNTVYVDIVNGEAGQLIGVNGTIDRPSNNLVDARAIADDPHVNSNRFAFVRSTSGVVLNQDYTGWIFTGRNPVAIDLNGQDVSLSSFVTVVVTGTCTNNTGVAVYDLCGILDLVCGEANFINCGLVGSLTLNQTNTRYNADRIWTNAALGDVPEIIFNGDGINPIEFDIGYLSGSYTVKGMTSVDKLSLGGNAYIFLDASNTGGTIEASGDIFVNDTVPVTPPTITKGINSRTLDEVRDVKGVGWVDETLVSLQALLNDIPNTAAFEARTLPSDSYFNFSTDQVIVATNNDKTGYSIAGTKTTLDALNDTSVNDIFTTVITEDYSADGAEFNLAQGLYLTVQNLQDFSFSGVTQIVRKLDGTTTAATYTLNDAVSPTSKTRAT